MLIKLIITLALLCFSHTATSLDLYVAPSGNDHADGLSLKQTINGLNGPFQTLARAQQAIRELKKTNTFSEPVTVHVQGGIYPLQKTLVFDIRDSGFDGREILWQSENGPAIISGGLILQDCAKGDDNIWACPGSGFELASIKYTNTDRKKGNIPGFELFIDQQPMHLARWPNSDWAHIKLPLDENTKFSSIEKLPSLESDQINTQVHIMSGNDWYDQYIGLESADQSQNKITLSGKTKYPFSSGRRFYLQNIKSELDAPGEWFYDLKTNRILFIPPNNTKPNEIIISTLHSLIAIKGANHISFRGLTFRYCTGIAINADKSSNLLFDHIEISNVGGRAIETKNSSYINISNSHIYNTGEGGILVTGGDRNTLQSGKNLIFNNHIHDFGRVLLTFTAAIEVFGVGSNISHNLVEQGPGTGVFINGNDHLFEKNEVHHVCEQESDCGAIYSGRDWTYRGNVVRYNSIHDLFGYGLKNVNIANDTVVYARPDGVRGVYLDDSVSGFSVIGNLFNNAGVMAIQLGSGRDNIIENNLISTDSYAIWVDNRIAGDELKKHLSQVPYQSHIWLTKYPQLGLPMLNQNWPEGNVIKRNIILSTKPGGFALRYFMPKQSNILANNLVWSTTGQLNVDYHVLDSLPKRSGTSWQEWVAEDVEQDSVYADPCVNITGNQVTFCAQSAAKKIGFESIPSDIGLMK
ncbi:MULTISPECIES: right-handed parallel beta-helix repeat-containing protein [Methylomonas]|uniref:Right handed beta helix domain-containing protein n=2 Tax=Methylomonas TaxID=416 RepID=A0A126T305_9GAMM|nr:MULTISPECIES: right-handed parallel beta-helix repeat-containing protein [Methylomonas]AMK76449.1 hypothetical protein JT25_008080 [Methylomonas denitrificans]OAH98707.1 hypothetical protein A1342_12820 [Methylomonas methanica]TCV88483.1 parallel beta helix pectate lyase-like protein [Methylomonas methanica]